MERLTPINLKLMPILLMAIVSVIMIIQYPTALAGACVDEDGDQYWANEACRPNLDPDDNDPCNPDPTASTCGNTVIESDVSGGVVVDTNETVVITNGATIDGSIEVNDGGTLIVEGGVTINGNIESIGGTITIGDGSTVSGNVSIKVSGAGGILTIKNASLMGNIESEGIDTLTINNIYLGGNISSTNDQNVSITGNEINGNLDITGPNNCTEQNNDVNGNNSGCP